MRRFYTIVLIALLVFGCSSAPATSGATSLYVTTTGAGEQTGADWNNAMTLENALAAVPNANGGHTIIVKPGTYMVANIYPAYAGASGNYNLLVGDFTGSYGSGSAGWVILDASATDNSHYPYWDHPNTPSYTGFKSTDYWCNFHSIGGPNQFQAGMPNHAGTQAPTTDGDAWDRWKVRRIMAVGSEVGLGFAPASNDTPFTVDVADCIGVGRFSGGFIGGSRRDSEPSVFTNCIFWALDWWADSGAFYARDHSASMSAYPYVRFFNCTFISPDNALDTGATGLPNDYTRIELTNCKLISLNMAQPEALLQSTPLMPSGIVHSNVAGDRAQYDFLGGNMLMGYVFSGAASGSCGFSTTGTNYIYLHFSSTLPSGFTRLAAFPTELIFPLFGMGANPSIGSAILSGYMK